MNNIKVMQDMLMEEMKRLSENINGEELTNEVARGNALSQSANTFIKTCNLLIRVEEVAEKQNVANEELSKKLGIIKDEK